MKLKLSLITAIVLSLTLLTGCGDQVEAPTEYEKFTRLFNQSVVNFDESISYSMTEDSYYNYQLASENIETSFVANYDIIKEPYYMKSDVTLDISTVGTNETKILVLQEADVYNMYLYDSGEKSSVTLTQSEFEEESENRELEITLEYLPETIEKIEENEINGDTIITYQTSITLADLNIEDQELFDSLIEIYISNVTNSSHYKDIEVTKTIVINATTEQFVEISYDTTGFLTEAFNDFITDYELDFDISNTSSEYKFIFHSLDNVTQDSNFINQVKE